MARNDMPRKVISTLRVGDNTVAIVKGDIMTARSGMTVTGATGRTYKVLSVGMAAGIDPSEIGRTADLLIEGYFDEKEIFV